MKKKDVAKKMAYTDKHGKWNRIHLKQKGKESLNSPRVAKDENNIMEGKDERENT